MGTDNLTCMIVLLSGQPDFVPREEFLRGPLKTWNDSEFMNAYMAHYEAARVSCPVVEQMRLIYTRLTEMQSKVGTNFQSDILWQPPPVTSCNRLAKLPSEEVV